jgi:hypothetical protein
MKENGNLRLIKNAIYGKSVEAHTLIWIVNFIPQRREGAHIANVLNLALNAY